MHPGAAFDAFRLCAAAPGTFGDVFFKYLLARRKLLQHLGYFHVFCYFHNRIAPPGALKRRWFLGVGTAAAFFAGLVNGRLPADILGSESESQAIQLEYFAEVCYPNELIVGRV